MFRNAGKALSEFTEEVAERRGFRRGPRESQQEADGYVFAAAEYEIRQARRAAKLSSAPEQRRWLRQAAHDLDRARNVYEPIAGFSDVNAGLDTLYRDRESDQEQLNDALAEADRKAALTESANRKP